MLEAQPKKMQPSARYVERESTFGTITRHHVTVVNLTIVWSNFPTVSVKSKQSSWTKTITQLLPNCVLTWSILCPQLLCLSDGLSKLQNSNAK